MTRSRRKRSAERRHRRRDDRRRQQLGERDDADGRGAGRLVRVQEDRDPRPVLHRRERDVRELDAAQGRVPEDLGGDAPRRSQPIQHAPHRAQCASRDPPTGPPSWRVAAVPARMGAWRSSPPTSSRPSAATTESASLLPARTYHDPAVFDWEREQHPASATGSRSRRAEEIAEPGSFLVREVLDESVLLVRGRDDDDPRVLQRVPPPGHRGGGARLRHRPSASSAPTTPGSTTSTASSSGPSTPRTSRTSPSRATACSPSAPRPGRASCSCASPTSR